MEPRPGPAGSGAAEGPQPQPEGPPSDCSFLTWSAEEVAEWVAQLGFPQYEECFRANGVSGRRLIHANCSGLPAMGVTDFGHMQVRKGRSVCFLLLRSAGHKQELCLFLIL
ncbi:sterile alpha motif domain-containing protein 15 isoform X3 [Passer domesticus]|uniref:sterile alpha motif domain-containing protein 15 isoform X3 n=1 Tax=Passer domesticus TaxID=48849 RepID=UPI0030FEAB64